LSITPVRSALERSTPVDEIQVLEHQNPGGVAEYTIILVIIIQTQYRHTIMFVVTNAKTSQATVRFTPQFRRCQDLLL
jgi:hypothetical protein